MQKSEECNKQRGSRDPEQVPLRIYQSHLSSDGCDFQADFASHRVRAEVDAEGRVKSVKQSESLQEPGVSDRGLLGPIATRTQRAGRAIKLLTSFSSIGAACPENLANFRDPDLALLDFLPAAARFGGLVRYGFAVQPERLLAQIAVAWPDATMAIATATKAQARSFQQKLAARNVAASCVKGCPEQPGRIIVGTFAALGQARLETNKRDLILILDALQALSKSNQVQTFLIQPDMPAVIGLLRNDAAPSRYEQDRLMATFGERRLTIPCHGLVERLPIVHWFPGAAKPGRWKLLQDRKRNRGLVRLARQAKSYFEQENRKMRTLLMTSQLGHALTLAGQLPGWPLVCGDVFEAGLTANQMRIFRDHRGIWNKGTHLIATVEGARQIERSGHPWCVIWAGGGSDAPELPRHWLDAEVESDHQIHLCDLDERYGHYRKASRKRRQAYQAREWCEAGQHPEDARIEAFLARCARNAEGKGGDHA